MSAVGTDECPSTAEHDASRRHKPNGGAKGTRGGIGHIQKTTRAGRWSQEDFSPRLSREETSRRQRPLRGIVIRRLAGIVPLRSGDG